MEKKETYTFEELCSGLEISIAQFSKRAGVDVGTISRIRRGYLTRQGTANRLLRAFSEIYGIKLSLDKVEGLVLQKHLTRKPMTPPVSIASDDTTPATEDSQMSSTKRYIGGAVKTEIPTDLPSGTMKLIDFVEAHGLPQSSLSYYINKGFKGEKIETTQRPRSSGPGMQHFLTPAQQEKALEILSRHGKLKTEQPEPEEKPGASEHPWWSPDGEEPFK